MAEEKPVEAPVEEKPVEAPAEEKPCEVPAAPVEEKSATAEKIIKLVIDKKYEELSLKELVNAPVSAISGISESDVELLKKAFGIDTIKELAENKYVKIAQTIVAMASLE